MLISALFVLLCVNFELLYIYTPRRQKENAFQLMILGCIFLMIYLGGIATIYVCVGIPVGIGTLSIALVLLDLVCGIGIAKRQCKAKLRWTKEYWIGGMILLIFLILIVFKRFGLELSLTYSDVDAARYLRSATNIYRSHSLTLNQYLTYLELDIFIEIFAPFISTINYYKALIVGHIFIQLKSILMFYIVANQINKKRNLQWINLIVTILYWCGFPLCNSTYGTFIQSMNGATYVMAAIYFTLRLKKRGIEPKRGLVCIMAVLFGLIMCYPFYLLITGIILLPEVATWIVHHWKSFDKRMKIIGIMVSLIMLLFGIVFGFSRFDYSFKKLFSYMAGEGLTYREPYQDFLLFIPVFIVYAALCRKNAKETRSIFRMTTLALIFTVIWFILFLTGMISSYYYYRIYYILWILVWWMSIDTIVLMLSEKKYIEVISYTVLCLCAIFTSIFNTNDYIYKIRAEAYMDKPDDKSLCPIYQFNAKNLKKDKKAILSQDELELFDYVNTKLGSQNVGAINSVYTSMQMQWYLGITNLGEGYHYAYDLSDYNLYSILAAADYSYNSNYILIEKDDSICMQYYDLLFSKYNILFENEAGYIFEKNSDEYWTGVAAYASDVPGLVELGAYVLNNLNNENVPIVCESEKWDEALYYSMYAGVDATVYANTDSQDFIATTYIYNNDDINYLMILKDSKVYKENKKYFHNQKIVYQTSAGMIIQHIGAGWMPSEQ